MFFGAGMSVVLPEPVSHQLYVYGAFEPELSAAMIAHVRSGDVVVDVGSHFGYFTLLASKLVGPGGRVHAFEPTPSTFERLCRNTAACLNVVRNREALFSREGELAFHDYGTVFSAFNGYSAPMTWVDPRVRLPDGDLRVPCRTLDAYCREHGVRPDFIKIDAESAEFDVLVGARGVLERDRPAVAVELGDHEGRPTGRRCVEFLRGLGFVAHECTVEGGLTEHEPRERYHNVRLLFLSGERLLERGALPPSERRVRVCLATLWPGVTSTDVAGDSSAATPAGPAPRFAYAGAFAGGGFDLIDAPRIRAAAATPGLAGGTLARAASVFRALTQADVVVTHLTSRMFLAGLMKVFRPGLKLLSVQYECAPPVGPLRFARRALKRWAYRRADRVLCLAPSLLRDLADLWDLRPGRLAWLPFGVDTRFFTPDEGIERENVVLVPGNHRRDERAVMDLARSSTAGPVVRVSNAPWVREMYLPALETDRGLSSSLRFERSVTPDRLRDLYRRARLVWLPLVASREPSGLTAALEAAACGCPLVVSEGMTCEVLARLGIPHEVQRAGEPADAVLARALAAAREHGRAAERERAAAVVRSASVETAGAALREQVAAVLSDAIAVEPDADEKAAGLRPSACGA